MARLNEFYKTTVIPKLTKDLGVTNAMQVPKLVKITVNMGVGEAVADSKNLPEKPDNATLLQIYALYKQATAGDAEGKRPGFSDMVGRAKWDAWNAVKGKDADGAMQEYVDLIESLK